MELVSYYKICGNNWDFSNKINRFWAVYNKNNYKNIFKMKPDWKHKYNYITFCLSQQCYKGMRYGWTLGRAKNKLQASEINFFSIIKG